ncbi:MAG: G8 domain-containing protein, partial [Ktedonobacteraceae bacterium]|nr:G8 domain-containing protein [Ktedonobacteraceae bacterium]
MFRFSLYRMLMRRRRFVVWLGALVGIVSLLLVWLGAPMVQMAGKLVPGIQSRGDASGNLTIATHPVGERWSDAKTWGGALPRAQAAVTIPAGKSILLDVSPPPLKSLLIEGTLVCDAKDLAIRANWIMVHVGGSFLCGSEQAPLHNHLAITLTGNNAGESVMGMGTKVLGVMGGTLELHGENHISWTHLGATASRGSTRITLERPVDWHVGDRIVITSTDYDADQAEEVTIQAVAGATVTLNKPLKYMHWGTVQSFGGSMIDERAEVGLLSHNIVIQGDAGSVATGFGGHTMIMPGSTVHIDGAEFFHMGQKRLKARYPIHWHMAGDASGSYIKNSTIDHSFNRCLTIHATNKVQVSSVVAFDTIGHCFFLEDGNETGNVLEHNLGVLTRKPADGEAILPTDTTPATYWITNPNNIFRGNVAAGSQFFGFWFAMPEHPTGLSKNANNDRLVWPRHTPLGEFSNNVAHSTSDNGLHVDDGANPDGSSTGYAYEPRQNPAVSSPPVTATFKNFTAYKTRTLGGWLRGSNLRLVGAKVADTVSSFIFAQGQILLQDSLVVGETNNKGNPASWEATGQDGRSLPQPWNPHTPVTGFDFYDGPQGVQRVTFINFRSNALRPAGALSYNPENN